MLNYWRRTAFLTKHQTIRAERPFLRIFGPDAALYSCVYRVYELGVSLLPDAIKIDDLLLARYAQCM